MQVPKSEIQTGAKKAAAKKPRVKMRDLAPRKNARGGNGITRNEPPLLIPPPGFMATSDEEKNDAEK